MVQEVIRGGRGVLFAAVVGLLATLVGCELQVVSVGLTGITDGETLTDAGSRALGITLQNELPEAVSVTAIEFWNGPAMHCSVSAASETCDWSFSGADNGPHRWKAVVRLSHGEPWQSTVANVEVAIPGSHGPPSPSGDSGLVGFIAGIGTANDVVIRNGLAYVASEQFGLAVADVSNPDQPRLLGSAEAPFVGQRIAVRRDLAVVGGTQLDGTNQIWVLDIADARMPRVRAQLGVETEILDLALDEHANRIVAAMGNIGVRTFDVTNRDNPVLIGTYDTPGTAFGLDVQGSLTYVADGAGGLQVLDHTGANGPSFVGSKTLSGVMRDVAVAGGIAYVADQQGSMKIVDVSAPAAPQLRYSTGIGSLGRRIAVDGGVIAVLGLNNGGDGGFLLSTFDRSNPTRPQLIGTVALDNAGGVATASGRVFVAEDLDALKIYDAHAPTAVPRQLKDAFSGRAIAERGGVLAVGGENRLTYEAELRIVAHSASGPEVLGTLSTNLSPSKAFLDLAFNDAGTLVIAAMHEYGIWIIDVSNPADPRHVGTYDSPGLVYGVAVEGARAYLADGTGPLQIVDFSDPSAPALLSWLSLSGVMRDLVLRDSIVYLSNQQGSIRIVDASDPAMPSYIYGTGINGLGRKIAAQGTRMIVSGLINDRSGGTRIDLFDLSVPNRPLLTDSTDFERVTGLAVHDDVAYVCTGPRGVQLFEVSGTALLPVDALPSFGDANDIVVSGAYVYVADSAATVSIFEL